MFSKVEADCLLAIGISWLNQEGLLSGFRSATITWTRGESFKSSVGVTINILDTPPHIALNYTQTDTETGEKKHFDHQILLTSTSCYFGGKRWWFICPLVNKSIACGRRVGKVYKDGDYFGCRHCYDLTYQSKKTRRGTGLYAAMNFLDLNDKANQLDETIKRRYYKGKPTRKQRQLYKLYGRSSGEYNKINWNTLR